MSFLYKRSDSPYWYAGVNVDGRWVRRSLGVSSRKAAAAKLRKLEQALADGEPAFVDGAPDLAEALSAYIEYCEARNRPKTMLEKRRFVRRYEAFFGAARAVPSVRQADVEAYVADRLKAAAGAPTINRELATLKNFFNFAVARGLCKANPVRGIKPLPEARRPIKIIPYGVLDKYFDWCRENDPLLFDVSTIAFNTGLRRGDIFKVRGEDVNVEDRLLTVVVSKRRGEKVQQIPLNDDALEVLARRRSDNGEGYVFPGRGTAHVTDIKKRFARALKTVGAKFRFMEFRHNFATRLMEAGAHIYTAKDLLGHEAITTTEKYLAAIDKSKRRAVERLERRRRKRR